MHRQFCALSVLLIAAAASAGESPSWHGVKCDGDYQGHLQGVCTNEKDAIYWSFTTVLVKTDHEGSILKQIPVPSHHGDLCFHKETLYVAVNLGKFNDPQGNADSWVYVYDAGTLELKAKHETQEVFHGAGGMDVMNDRFYVVGGLPKGVQENYVCEYDSLFRFQKKHIVKSGWTNVGIQTAAFHDGAWWFGCYGSPKILLKTDVDFKMLGRYEFDNSLGIVGIAKDRFLVAKGPRTNENRCMGSLHLAKPDAELGLVFMQE
jgi:hypothetical protein